MDPLNPSGYMLPDRWARTAMEALQDLLGLDGFDILLNIAHLNQYREELPEASLERNFDFAEFTSLFMALEELYGVRGGHGIALRAGRASFRNTLSNFGALAGTRQSAFQVLPQTVKLNLGLKALARISDHVSDQRTSVKENRNDFEYTIHRNPVTWERSEQDRPICFFHVGILEETANQASGGNEFRIDEIECQAMGALTCNFRMQKQALA
jgi:predicted hydrocarbon binding protein